ncbi:MULTISPECIES: hypothetical protein [Streptomyces]|uniref:hypothetical protein n=1 Tax=Streptomyces TaxID=1883 RepID=UPI0022498BD7|nr:hypothetical protein [Streptomyces sp. JHD 1]MCX2969474.1 hypothetical protein [Streptomyces sp. JHD 1]
MGLLDHADITFGTTDTGGSFAVVNSDLPQARTILASAGFTPHEYQGQLLYQLPLGSSPARHLNAVAQAYNTLLRYTPDIAYLCTPPLHGPDEPAQNPDVEIHLPSPIVTATARQPQVHEVLTRYGWQPAGALGHHVYVLPDEMSDSDRLGVVVMTKANLYAIGTSVRVDCGIPCLTANSLSGRARPPALASFAAGLAARLPGDWSLDYQRHDTWADRLRRADRIWTAGESRPSLALHTLEDAVLHGTDGLQLNIVNHRASRFLVCPLIPADVHEDAADRIPAPPVIGTHADPRRAAWRVTDRLLPHYLAATRDARRTTTRTRHQPRTAPQPTAAQPPSPRHR